MLKLLKEILTLFYDEKTESLCVRLLYFFNTIDTYFIVAGVVAFDLVCFKGFGHLGSYGLIDLFLGFVIAMSTAKIADFHPYFAAPALLVIAGASLALGLAPMKLALLLAVNAAIFFAVQFVFMGIPDSIVARDPKVAFIKIFNSLYTFAPTTVSFPMSLFFSFHLSFWTYASCEMRGDARGLAVPVSFALLLALAFMARGRIPQNLPFRISMPRPLSEPPFKRLLILNIDGTRLDVYNSLKLPTAARLKREGACHSKGLLTVYRALTNPAFASIFTGAPPAIHGVRDNNYGQQILTEGLPDIVPAIAYGSMHVKHFCKDSWEKRIVSLPETSAYGCDDLMVSWLKEDIEKRKEIRLFVADFSEADFSEADFLAHAYGSKSKAYKGALTRIDARIGALLDWLKESGNDKGMGVIVCSDHGIAAIDHSYLLADSERWVPFMLWGDGVRKGFSFDERGTIMDICCTAAWALGVPYPRDAKGQVFEEAFRSGELRK